tara:strand:+ start:54 stop:482 length:429 start_codon:yes stop_codon:yes gene_type:complete
MQDKHKNILLGFLAGKEHPSEGDLFATIFNYFLLVILGFISAIYSGMYLFANFSMTQTRATGFGFLIFFVSFYIYSKVLLRFQRLIYAIIFGTPLMFFLLYLFFPNLSFEVWTFIFNKFPGLHEVWCIPTETKFSLECSKFL